MIAVVVHELDYRAIMEWIARSWAGDAALSPDEIAAYIPRVYLS